MNSLSGAMGALVFPLLLQPTDAAAVWELRATSVISGPLCGAILITICRINSEFVIDGSEVFEVSEVI